MGTLPVNYYYQFGASSLLLTFEATSCALHCKQILNIHASDGWIPVLFVHGVFRILPVFRNADVVVIQVNLKPVVLPSMM